MYIATASSASTRTLALSTNSMFENSRGVLQKGQLLSAECMHPLHNIFPQQSWYESYNASSKFIGSVSKQIGQTSLGGGFLKRSWSDQQRTHDPLPCVSTITSRLSSGTPSLHHLCRFNSARTASSRRTETITSSSSNPNHFLREG